MLLALWLLCLPVMAGASKATIPAFDSPVVDTTGTLDATSKQQLEQQSLALQQRKGSQLQVLLVPSTAPETIEQYAVRAFEQFKLGRKGVDDGLLLVVAKDDRKVRIEVGYGLEGAIPDITAGRVIQEYLVPKFRQRLRRRDHRQPLNCERSTRAVPPGGEPSHGSDSVGTFCSRCSRFHVGSSRAPLLAPASGVEPCRRAASGGMALLLSSAAGGRDWGGIGFIIGSFRASAAGATRAS